MKCSLGISNFLEEISSLSYIYVYILCMLSYIYYVCYQLLNYIYIIKQLITYGAWAQIKPKMDICVMYILRGWFCHCYIWQQEKINLFLFIGVIKQRVGFLSASESKYSECFLFAACDGINFQEHGNTVPLIRNLAKLKVLSPGVKLLRRIR